MIGLTYHELVALNPCKGTPEEIAAKFGGPRKWGKRRVSAVEARAAGVSLDRMIWAASALALTEADVKRRVRLWAADCAAHVLHIYEINGKSDAPRAAIIAARRYARGEISAEAVARAAKNAARAAGDASSAAASAAARAAGGTAWAAGDASWAAAGAAERDWQYDRFVAWLSDPEPDDWPLPDAPVREIEAL